MKFPKITRRYCPSCRKHTEQKISLVSSGHKRGTLKKGSPARAKLRGSNRGFGGQGKYSKPPITAWKRKTKSTKKASLMYTCQACKKSSIRSKGIRTGKVTFTQ